MGLAAAVLMPRPAVASAGLTKQRHGVLLVFVAELTFAGNAAFAEAAASVVAAAKGRLLISLELPAVLPVELMSPNYVVAVVVVAAAAAAANVAFVGAAFPDVHVSYLKIRPRHLLEKATEFEMQSRMMIFSAQEVVVAEWLWGVLVAKIVQLLLVNS